MNLGEISDTLVWGAATAYTIAMVAFATDLAHATDAVGQRKAKERASTAESGGSPESPGGSVAVLDAPRSSKALGIAMSTMWAGFAIHLVAVVLRGLAAGHVPWANMYEFWLTGTFVAAGLFLVLQLWRDVRFLGVIVSFIVVTFLMIAINGLHVEADGLQPALQDYWLVIHVGVAVAATGVFTVAFAMSALQLFARLSGQRLDAPARAGDCRARP